MRTVIIQGSSRSEGHTNTMVTLLQARLDCDVVDLNDYMIRPFDYEYLNQDDDFAPLIRRIANDYDLLIFATPVYWYSMSGTMKIFFDRLTDCLKVLADVGEQLKGKSMALMMMSSDEETFESVRTPFPLTASYMHMHYLGDVHCWIDGVMEEEVKRRIDAFADQLMEAGKRGKFDIRYVKGDATRPYSRNNKMIVHICNDVGGWGRGFVMALSKRWSKPEAEYRTWYASQEGFALGEVQFVEVDEDLWVVNMIGQHKLKKSPDGQPPIRYDAVEKGLAKVAAKALELDASVHMPRIGCGLAGGSWDQIEPLIEKTLVAAGVMVTVYDF